MCLFLQNNVLQMLIVGTFDRFSVHVSIISVTISRLMLILNILSCSGLVDRPTQLICISDISQLICISDISQLIFLIFICQQRNTKDIAGQSASSGHNMALSFL